MNIKYIAIPALALVASCSWTERQTQSAMDWADRTMPTYDAKPAANSSAASNGMVPDNYNGYPYNSSVPRSSMASPGTSGVSIPPLPGYAVAPAGVTTYSSKGLTPAQSSSAGEGGNSRPTAINAAPVPLHSGAVQSPPPIRTIASPAPMAPSVSNSAPAAGRRVPAGMLPPTAIQPAPYGEKAAPAKSVDKGDDFPTEYKNRGDQDSMILPPPI